MIDADWLTTREAAHHVGYRPGVDGDGNPLRLRDDKEVLAFYAWARRSRVPKKRRGRTGLLFKRHDLDRALERCTTEVEQGDSRFDRMETMARAHARGEVRPS